MDYKKKKLLEFEEGENATADLFGDGAITKKSINDEDDFGYELDESGMIPKLEELKAAGVNSSRDESEDSKLQKNTARHIEKLNLMDEGIDLLEDEENTSENEDEAYVDDELWNEDDFSNLKIDFYDDEDSSISRELGRIASALERIANSLEKGRRG
ncbi:hypothetical protein [Peptostreptococcus porci]|uniref:hypothetical protein n=1 Tax=Peptostreptococcus porci TaxID=2652282 RepID=UPI002A9121C9|nr:hypothetical protein [Peptostreptococcus porci]MDY5436586.1 hypothetical protein [Peptostreptococcus porci]